MAKIDEAIWPLQAEVAHRTSQHQHQCHQECDDRDESADFGIRHQPHGYGPASPAARAACAASCFAAIRSLKRIAAVVSGERQYGPPPLSPLNLYGGVPLYMPFSLTGGNSRRNSGLWRISIGVLRQAISPPTNGARRG